MIPLLGPTLSALPKVWSLLALLAPFALVPQRSLQGQQVPQVFNNRTALASAPTLILADELRFVPDKESIGASPPEGLMPEGEWRRLRLLPRCPGGNFRARRIQ